MRNHVINISWKNVDREWLLKKKNRQKDPKPTSLLAKSVIFFYCDFVFFTLEGAMHTDHQHWQIFNIFF